MNASKVYSLSENCSSPHGREGGGEQSSLAFKTTRTETGRCERPDFDTVKMVLFYTAIKNFLPKYAIDFS